MNLMKLSDVGGLPRLASTLHASTNGWLHKAAEDWDLNHISRGLFGELNSSEFQGDGRRTGSHSASDGKERVK